MKKMALLDRKLAALAAAVVLAACAAPNLSAQNSPIGSWDVVMSGPQRGVMQITFASDFTLIGSEIITQRLPGTHATDEVDVRTPDGGGRTIEGGGTTTNLYHFGGADIEGIWSYDTKGRVIGNFVELSDNLTNGMSFSANVRPGVRLVMSGTRGGRRITFRGVPLAALPSFSGDYYGSGKRGGIPFTELYTVTPGATPNSYNVVGTGPYYVFAGSLFISGQRQAALYTESSQSTNGLIRSVAGSFNLNRGTGTLLGLSEDPGGSKAPHSVRTSIVKQ